MEGNLKKWVNIVTGWQTLYFILHDDLLTFCEKKGTETKGVINLRIAKLVSFDDDPLRIAIYTGMSEMHVRASTLPERVKWFEAMRRAQEKAKKEEEETPGGEDDIQVQDGRLSVGNKDLINADNLDRIVEDVSEISKNHARFNELLAIVQGKLQKQNQHAELAKRLEALGKEIKAQVQECTKRIETEKKSLCNITKKFEHNIALSSPARRTYANGDEQGYDNGYYGIQNGFEPGSANETQFQSFLDDAPGDLMPLHSKEELQITTNKYPNELSLNLETSSKQNIFPTLKNYGTINSIDLDTIHPIINKLVNENPSFTKFPISNEKTRKRLPHLIDPNEKFDVWGVLKDVLGKDLGRFSVPVFLNEPISMLQRLAEQMEYHTLLDKANQCTDPHLKLAYCAAFGFSGFASSVYRTKKPFNPILGETYEFIPEDNSFFFISEQVSHHPPVSAGFCENSNFVWYGDSDVKGSFMVKSLEFKALGTTHIVLKKKNDHITYKRPTITINNILFGKMYVDYYGEMPFYNNSTGDIAVINFKQRGWTGKNAYEAEGTVKDKHGNVKYIIVGKWDSYIKAINADTKQETTLWTATKLPADHEKEFSFGEFQKQLNHISSDMLSKICPTDSRFRSDQRAYEYGDRQLAADEKHRLEEKQRARRKEMKEANTSHEARWFQIEQDSLTNEKVYKYKGGYLEARNKRAFKETLDLFT